MKEGRTGFFERLAAYVKKQEFGRLKERDIKNLALIVLLGFIGIYLLITGGSQTSGRRVTGRGQGADIVSGQDIQDVAALSGSRSQTTIDLERKLSSILSRIRGAGSVEVCIHFEGDGEKRFAENTVTETRKTQDKDAQGVTRSNEETKTSRELVISRGQASTVEGPVVVRTLSPKVEGVIVVADGASDSRVRLALTDAVITVLDIPPHRVIVLPREGR